MYKDIDVVELGRWREANDAFVLLDVREDDEVALVAIPGSVHIPMGQITQRFTELDADAKIAVLCHLGGRSAKVAQFLASRGFTNVVNVDGGIDEYAERIDPELARY